MRDKPKDKYTVKIERVQRQGDRNEMHPFQHISPLQEVELNSAEVIEVMALIARMRGRVR
jgi:hypothetical protein